VQSLIDFKKLIQRKKEKFCKSDVEKLWRILKDPDINPLKRPQDHR
jgi:hypothetical protein